MSRGPDLGPLTELLDDPAVTDVLVNAPDEVWVDRDGTLHRTSLAFPDENAVRALAVRLAAAAGRRLDAGAPFADVRLPGGHRLHAVLPPVAASGTCLSIRALGGRRFDLDDLHRAGALDDAQLPLLRAIVAARLAVVVSGGTGSGKTTLLGALLGAVAPGERLVLAEDTGELQVDHPHVVRLQGRAANVEDAGSVTLRDLVRQALRMRPDRLVVGEVRGAEVLDLLVALNTGHDGGMTTLHANAARDVPARLEALGSLAGLSATAVHSHLGAGVDVVLHLNRSAGGVRQLAEVATVRHEPGRPVRLQRADGPGAPGWPHLARRLAGTGIVG
jgi:pilus assembly protein CpaF